MTEIQPEHYGETLGVHDRLERLEQRVEVVLSTVQSIEKFLGILVDGFQQFKDSPMLKALLPGMSKKG